MALPSAIKLFINPRSGLAFGNFAGTSQVTNPTFTLGDSALIELYLVEDTIISAYPRQELGWPGSPGIKVAVGPIDESPLAGTWTISFAGDTTSALAFNASAAVVQAALNLLASITAAGGVTVSKIGDNYNIVFNQNGARSELTTNGASLTPLSTATIAALQIGDSNRPSITLIHLQRTVAGLATSFAATATSAIAVQSLSAWDGSRASYRASIYPDPKGGSFSLSVDVLTGDDVSTAALPVGSSAIDVQNALSVGALADGKVSVSQIGAYAYDITLTVQPGTLGLTANGSGIQSFSGYVGELSLNTAEAISLLDGANEVATNLEVEITSDSKTLTVLQIPCVLQNAVIDAAAVVPLVLDSYLSQNVADGRYTRQANNLSDLESVSSARTNLEVYSTSSVDSALALKANLAGATFGGNIVRDNGLGQTVIGPASVSFSQTGGGGSFATYASSGITFPDSTVQTTAFNTSGASFSGTVYLPGIRNLLNTDLVVDSYNDTAAGTHYLHKFTPFDGKFVLAPNGGGLVFPDGTTQATAATSPDLSGYALKSGATFTGKVNFTTVGGAAGLNVGIGGTSASATTAGDLWIPTGGANLNFRDGTGAWKVLASLQNGNVFNAPQVIDTTNTNPGLRITQKGTGSALVVEDSTTPDSDALIVDANGNLGIGVSNNPGSIWSGAGEKLEVHGNAKVRDILTTSQLIVTNDTDIGLTVNGVIYFPNYGGTLAGMITQTNPIASGSFSSGDYPQEIVFKINGNLYAVPARQIT